MSLNNLKIKIEYEMAQIEAEYSVIDSVKECGVEGLNKIEIRAVASALHSIYNGIEKILMMVLKDRGITFISDESWHSNILKLSKENDIISSDVKTRLRELMGFRHYFRHSYGFMLDNELMLPLYDNLASLLSDFKNEIMNK